MRKRQILKQATVQLSTDKDPSVRNITLAGTSDNTLAFPNERRALTTGYGGASYGAKNGNADEATLTINVLQGGGDNTWLIAQNALNVASSKIELAKSLVNGTNDIISGSSSISRSQKQIALLKALFDNNALVEFACEFTYYPQMMITQLDISRDDVRTGSFIVNITLQEFVGVEIETADLDSAQFAESLSRNDIQCLAEENVGEQKIMWENGYLPDLLE